MKSNGFSKRLEKRVICLNMLIAVLVLLLIIGCHNVDSRSATTLDASRPAADVDKSVMEHKTDIEVKEGNFKVPLKANRSIDYERFFHYWRLHETMRFDYDRIMEPCEEHETWMPYYYPRTPSLVTSANLSGVELDIKPAGQFSRILIESFSLLNTQKTIGGDSWRVMVGGVRSVTPLVMDNMDGTYEASFLLTEPGYYHVNIYLEYTLCDGFKDPPPRWFKQSK